jgi:hypothetical protein
MVNVGKSGILVVDDEGDMRNVISDNYSYRSRCLSYECYHNQDP